MLLETLFSERGGGVGWWSAARSTRESRVTHHHHHQTSVLVLTPRPPRACVTKILPEPVRRIGLVQG